MERRKAPRRVPAPGEMLARVRLRTGAELAVVNVSSAGVLVEGVVRLLPGRRLEVHVQTDRGRVLVGCRVLRSCVCHLEAAAVHYRSVLVFERSVDVGIAGEHLPDPPQSGQTGEGSRFPKPVSSP